MELGDLLYFGLRQLSDGHPSLLLFEICEVGRQHDSGVQLTVESLLRIGTEDHSIATHGVSHCYPLSVWQLQPGLIPGARPANSWCQVQPRLLSPREMDSTCAQLNGTSGFHPNSEHSYSQKA